MLNLNVYLILPSWESCHLGNCHLGKCTFGKLPLGKLHIWEVVTWEIVTWVGSCSWENALGKHLTPLQLEIKFLLLTRIKGSFY